MNSITETINNNHSINKSIHQLHETATRQQTVINSIQATLATQQNDIADIKITIADMQKSINHIIHSLSELTTKLGLQIALPPPLPLSPTPPTPLYVAATGSTTPAPYTFNTNPVLKDDPKTSAQSSNPNSLQLQDLNAATSLFDSRSAQVYVKVVPNEGPKLDLKPWSLPVEQLVESIEKERKSVFGKLRNLFVHTIKLECRLTIVEKNMFIFDPGGYDLKHSKSGLCVLESMLELPDPKAANKLFDFGSAGEYAGAMAQEWPKLDFKPRLLPVEQLEEIIKDGRKSVFEAACRNREEATFAFGSILEGPFIKTLSPLVQIGFGFLLSHVQDTTACAIGRVFELCLNDLKYGASLVHGNDLKFGNNIFVLGKLLDHKNECLSYVAAKYENVDIVRNLGFVSMHISKPKVQWKDNEDKFNFKALLLEHGVHVNGKKVLIFYPGVVYMSFDTIRGDETQIRNHVVVKGLFAAGVAAGFHANVDVKFVSDVACLVVYMMKQLLLRSERIIIMCPIPQYPLYSASCALHGGSLVPYFLDKAAGWRLETLELQNDDFYISYGATKESCLERLMQNDAAQQVLKLRPNSDSTFPTSLSPIYDLEGKVGFKGKVMNDLFYKCTILTGRYMLKDKLVITIYPSRNRIFFYFLFSKLCKASWPIIVARICSDCL